MKRRDKVEVIADAIHANYFGTLAETEARWLAEHIADALKQAKKEHKAGKGL